MGAGSGARASGPPAQWDKYPGRAQPSQTLPSGEGKGKPGFPFPLREGCALPNPPIGGVFSPQPSMRLRRTTPQ